MNFKNFRAFGKPARVALTSGHVFLFNTEDWVSVPEFAWSACYAAQCLSEDMITNNHPRLVTEQVETTVNKSLARRDVIKTLMYEFHEKHPNFFDKTGYPNTKRLCTAAGFVVTPAERTDIWNEITAELA